MLDQNNLFRENALGSFHDLFLAVTTNPAMLVFLDGIYNDKREPNENYAREMMELFSLGADRGAYTETDVREMARALTGWTADWTESSGPAELPLRPLPPRQTAPRRSSARTANGTGKTRCGCASPIRCTPPSSSASCGATSSRPPPRKRRWRRCRASTSALATASGRPRGDPPAPRLPRRPRAASPRRSSTTRACCARSARPIDTTAWAWLCAGAGQQLFYPPNVSGWDFTRWLDTSTGEGALGNRQLRDRQELRQSVAGEGEPRYSETETPRKRCRTRSPTGETRRCPAKPSSASPRSRSSCLEGLATAGWQQSPYRAMRQNALRMLIATSPDMQVS